jgi:hypothetical protein
MAREDEKEYYAARPVKGFDWVTASQKGLKQIEGVIAERQKERDENLQFEQETDTALLREEKGQSKDLNEIIAQGAFTSKKKAYELTRQLKMNKLSSQEYRIAMNNLQDGWNNFNDISKGFNEKLLLFAQRGQQDIASIMESAAAKEFSLMADLKGKDIKISDTGKVLWGSGKTYSSMTDLNNTPQQLHDQVKLSDVVNSKAEFIGTFKEAIRAGDLYSTKGTAAMENLGMVDGISEYKRIVKGVQDEILAGPNMMNNAASVLGDNMLGPNGETWYTYKESDLVDPDDPSQGFKDGLGFDGAELELDANGELVYGIKTIYNDQGQLTANVTDVQMDTARVGIENTFRAQIGIEQQPLPYNNPNERPESDSARRRRLSGIENFKNVVAILEGDASRFNNPGDGRTDAKFVGKDLVYKKNGVEKRVDLEGLSNEAKENAIYTYYSTGTEKDIPGVVDARKAWKRAGSKYSDDYGEVTGDFEAGSALDLTDNKGNAVKLMAMPKVPQMKVVKQGKEKMEDLLPTFASAGELQAYISERSENIRKVSGDFDAYVQNLKTGQMVNYPGKYGRTVYEDEDRIGFKDANVSGKPLDSYVKDVLTNQVLKLPNGKRPLKGQKGVNFNITNKGEVQLSYTDKKGEKVTLSASPRTDPNWMQTFLNEFTESYDPAKKKLTVAQLKAANPNLSDKEIIDMYKEQ